MRLLQISEQFAYLKGYHYALTVIMRRWQLTEHVSYLTNQNHDLLTVVMRRWQLTEHVLYLRGVSPCSDRYHEMMTTDGHEYTCGGITMLWPLSWEDDNSQRMFRTFGIKNHALSVVMGWWQLIEHVSYLMGMAPCSDRCHETMTTDGACFIHGRYITMLWPLSWDDDKWRSMFHTRGIHYHALTVVMGRWQLTEHFAHLRDV